MRGSRFERDLAREQTRGKLGVRDARRVRRLPRDRAGVNVEDGFRRMDLDHRPGALGAGRRPAVDVGAGARAADRVIAVVFVSVDVQVATVLFRERQQFAAIVIELVLVALVEYRSV